MGWTGLSLAVGPHQVSETLVLLVLLQMGAKEITVSGILHLASFSGNFNNILRRAERCLSF